MTFRFPIEFPHIGAGEYVAFSTAGDIPFTAALNGHTCIRFSPFGLPASGTFICFKVRARGAIDPAVRH